MKGIFPLLLLALLFGQAFGQSESIRKQHFNLKKNIALEGYDPVSYFDGKPLEGDSKIKLVYKDIIYQFASTANLKRFQLTPDKYEPAYGGWCAYAMGETGEKVKIDPETFKLVNGRLHLFYNFWGSNTLEDWERNEKKLKDNADHNWSNIVR